MGSARLHREHYGRGADRIRTTIHPELAITVLEDCFTTVEKRMIAEGEFLKVRETRIMFQDWMGPRFIQTVEDQAWNLPTPPKRPQTSQPPFSVQSGREDKSEAESEAA